MIKVAICLLYNSKCIDLQYDEKRVLSTTIQEICNTFSIVFLSTGVAAIAGICTFGREFLAAALTDQILTVYLAVLSLPPIVGLIAAPVAMTVFLGVDGGVEHPTAAAADEFADSVSSDGKTRFLIRFFQIILIVLLPFFVCHIHGDTPPFTGVTEKQCGHFDHIIFW